MSLSSKKILEIFITTSTKEEILEEIEKYLVKKQETGNRKQEIKSNPLVIFTPNPEIITFALRDDNFKRIVNSAQINLPDGTGTVWALKRKFDLKAERISGADFLPEMAKLAQKLGSAIGLIGGKGRVALYTRECLQKDYDGLKVEVLDSPDFVFKNTKLALENGDGDKYFQALVREIAGRKLSMVFVALGFPKQEYFTDRLRRELRKADYNKPLVIMTVGGAFDYIGGKSPRAPGWMREGGLEWLYRLIREPWRLGRQLRGAEFFLEVISEN